MKSVAAQARMITALLVTGLGLFVVVRQRGDAPVIAPVPVAAIVATPQDAVYAMLDAARAGEVAKYLDHYSGPLADSLRQSMSEQGEARFAQYLRQTNEPVKGIAKRDAIFMKGDLTVERRLPLARGRRGIAHRSGAARFRAARRWGGTPGKRQEQRCDTERTSHPRGGQQRRSA